MNEMLHACELTSAESVLEFGHGTGALATHLLDNVLPDLATYEGWDASESMFHETVSRLSNWVDVDRACLRWKRDDDPLNDYNVGTTRNSRYGSSKLNWGGFDRFVSTYVFDKLPPADIEAALDAAHAELHPDVGRICIVAQTRNPSLVGTFVTSLWSSLYALVPQALAASRPIRLTDYVHSSKWNTLHHNVVSKYGIASEVLVASKVPPPPPPPEPSTTTNPSNPSNPSKPSPPSKPPPPSKPSPPSPPPSITKPKPPPPPREL